MGRRAARAIVGMGLAACALAAGRLVVPDSATAATPVVASTVVRGVVPAEAGVSGDGWTAGRPEVGRYLVAVDGASDLALTGWAGVATAGVTPVGEGVFLVSFLAPSGEPVDVVFGFSALAARPG